MGCVRGDGEEEGWVVGWEGGGVEVKGVLEGGEEEGEGVGRGCDCDVWVLEEFG